MHEFMLHCACGCGWVFIVLIDYATYYLSVRRTKVVYNYNMVLWDRDGKGLQFIMPAKTELTNQTESFHKPARKYYMTEETRTYYMQIPGAQGMITVEPWPPPSHGYVVIKRGTIVTKSRHIVGNIKYENHVRWVIHPHPQASALHEWDPSGTQD